MKEIKKEDIFKKINEEIDLYKPSGKKKVSAFTEHRDGEATENFEEIFNDENTATYDNKLNPEISRNVAVENTETVRLDEENTTVALSSFEAFNENPDNKKERVKKKALIAPIIVAFAVVVAICSAFVFVVPEFKDNNKDKVKEQTEIPVFEEISDIQAADAENTKEMRGVWIASVGNLNYPSKSGLDSKALSQEIDAILKECSDVGFNAIFFQVRPAADSLCKSDIFPWSAFLSTEQGKTPENDFDPLEYILSKAPEYGIEIHAWVNPFRVTTGSTAVPKHDVNELSENHPARKNPGYVIPYADGKLYFDPGNPQVRKLVVAGISELCKNYPELSGIHLDDYFYPYPVSGAEFDDSASYEKYGNGLTRDNWRRNNVNMFVKAAYDAVKEQNCDMKFGVSPFGIWANNSGDTPVEGSVSGGLEAYNSLYCDALAWVNGAYVDYIAPQDYWSFNTKAASFDNIARWWNANLDGKKTELYIGHAAYKAADYTENEIGSQVEFARSLISYKGSIFYGYEDIKKNTAGVRDSIKQSFNSDENITAVKSNGAGLSINYPVSNTTVNDKGYIFGSSDPAKPLTVNGKRVSRTKDGYFILFENFKNGENVYELKCGDEALIYTINRVSVLPAASNNTISEMEEFEITDVSPNKPLWLIPGDKVVVKCDAPAGSKVYAKFGSYTVEMKPVIYSADTVKNYRESYTGSVTVRDIIAGEGEIADIGKLTVYAEKNGKRAEKTVTDIKQMGTNVKAYVQVKKDYSYLKTSTTSSFYKDPLPQSVGMRDYITAFVNGYYRLRCGYYISEEDVDVVYDKELTDENRLLGVTVNANIKDTSSNKKNFTDISFGTVENVPVNAYIENGVLTVIFHNTEIRSVPEVVVEANPMIASGKGYVKNNRPVYEFTLKDAENYYGYNVIYENGFIIIRLNNPQSLANSDTPLSGKTIVVDAGHGGEDNGAQGPSSLQAKLQEKDLNLAIALELREELEALGAEVLMIREDDITVTLEERIKYLSEIIPDLMISVHHNSVADTVNAAKARGYLGLYSDDAGVLLANAVSDTVTTELSRYQRKTSYQALAVARNHRFPSTLCEMSFISCPEEFQWTITPGNYQRSAGALAKGVIEFYKRQEQYLKY